MGNVPEENQLQFQQRTGLFLARFCTSAWIGAASLFVVVGVIEVTRGGFDSTTKDALVAIRFPAFYAFGTILGISAWIGAWFAGNTTSLTRGRRRSVIGLLTMVLVLMAVDYFWIYQPLLQMVTPPGQTKPSSFAGYHEASKWINLAGLMLCFFACLLINWPSSTSNPGSHD